MTEFLHKALRGIEFLWLNDVQQPINLACVILDWRSRE